MRKFTSLPCILLLAASAGFAQFAAADSEHTTPRASEISPAEWRSQQLRAADQSDKIMHDARKLPGLLAQYLYMQGQYDANHERAFQIIFGQYLSWFQTFIGDYDGAAASFSMRSATEASRPSMRSTVAGPSGRRPPMNRPFTLSGR